MERDAVRELSQKIFLAELKDDLRDNEAVSKIVCWAQRKGGGEYPPSAAEPLIRHFLAAYGWEPEKTAAKSVIDLAALLPAPQPQRERRGALTAGDRTELEEAATKYLRINPKATRDQLSKHLDCSAGLASSLMAWKARNSHAGRTKVQQVKGARIGLEIAEEIAATSSDATLQQLLREQELDAKIDGIRLDK